MFPPDSQSTRNNELDLSIFVSSALYFDPNIFITMTDLSIPFTNGRCDAFDAFSRGYVHGEGVCAAIWKRQARAGLDGDTTGAIVRGATVNHDGKRRSYTSIIRSAKRTGSSYLQNRQN